MTNLLSLLFPKVRSEVFRLLFAETDRELHLRDLARQSNLSLKTVQDEVGKLLAADLLIDRRDGNRRYYRANGSHPLFASLQQIVLKTAGLRDVLAQALEKIEGIECALVFGSLAKGPGKALSDVDLLVIGDTGLRALAPAIRLASERLGREVNPITFTAGDYKRKKKSHPLLCDIEKREMLFIRGTADDFRRLGQGRVA